MTKKIDKKDNKKRQEQNRLAQKVFRERNQVKMNDLKQRLQELEEMREIYEQGNVKELIALRKENSMLKQQRLVMISQIDKLRQDNIMLSTRQRTRSRPNTHRPQLPVKGMPSLPLPWTSHKHTFVGSSTSSSHDSNSVTTTKSSEEKIWQDSNQYPGYPQWAPPSITRKNLLPQPPPLHVSTGKVELPPTVPPQFDMFNQINLNYGAGSRPSQAPRPANQEPFFMPFLPSTNAMVPLYHHMPFESGPTSTGIFESLNDWWDADQLSTPLASRDMAFEPLEVMLNSAISSTASLNHVPIQNENQGMNVNLGTNLDCDLSNINNLINSVPSGNHSRLTTAATMHTTASITGSTNDPLDFHNNVMNGETLTFQDMAINHQMEMDAAAKIRLANVFTPL